MKIIRWLFSNFFLILLIVIVIYGYMFWGNLTGSDTPAGKAIAYLSTEFVEVEEFINAVKSKQQSMQDDRQNALQDEYQPSTASSGPASSQEQAAANGSGGHADAAANTGTSDARSAGQSAEVAQSEAAVVFSESIQQQSPVTISYSQNKNPVKQNTVAKVGPQDAVGSGLAALSTNTAPLVKSDDAANKNEHDVFVPVEVEKQLENVDNQGKVIDPSQQAGNVKDIWVTARKSFYQRNYALSEQSYLKVIDSTEDNFDAYGELGNVYFNQGKNKQAADAYYEAASIFLRKGQINRARSLTGLLRHLDRSKAEELQKSIEAARSNNENKG
jgi:tetratricopeptide (TPR) repeat protein